MSADLQTIRDRLDAALSRIQRIEDRLDLDAAQDARWQYLVTRVHPWRKQLSIKGRNLTVGQLVSTIRANQLSADQAAEDLGLPPEAVREALTYFDENRALIELEVLEERRRLAARGHRLEPQDLPR